MIDGDDKIMKNITKLLINSTLISLSILTLLIYRAGSWDEFKLKHFHLTSIFHDQEKELNDIKKKNIALEKNSRINLDELLNGGPPKDGIPSIDAPQFETANQTSFSEQELVIGVVVNQEAKAYPLGIMNWHEIVNDTIGGINVTISYCPLCDTIVAFKRSKSTYGVSGKLYQSCLVMYDRSDDTLYSQPWALGIVGENVNNTLQRIPAVQTTLGNWLKKYPKSQILSTTTGYNRDYFRYPYGNYKSSEDIIFPVRNQKQLTYHPKAIVTYIWEEDGQIAKNHFSGSSYQFNHEELKKVGSQIVNFNNRDIRIRWDKEMETVIVEELNGSTIPSSTAFAFVYPSFFD